MALWNIDLSTEDGALGAAQMGGAACFVGAVLGVLGAISAGGMAAKTADGGIATVVIGVAILEILLFVIAGFRMREGKGVIWGGSVAVMLALELVLKLLMLSVIGIIINVILLIVVINGIRGARALHKGVFNEEEVAEIFS